MKLSKFFVMILTAFFVCPFPGSLDAQDRQSVPLQNRASQYHLGEKDQILMSVNVWGYVARPGQYVVPRNTDLISLISFAGGPREGANLAKVNIIRGGDLEHTRPRTNGSKSRNGRHSSNGRYAGIVPILDVDVKGSLKKGNVGAIPVLKAGDTVIIPQSFGNRFKNAVGISSLVGIIAATASLALIVDRVSR